MSKCNFFVKLQHFHEKVAILHSFSAELFSREKNKHRVVKDRHQLHVKTLQIGTFDFDEVIFTKKCLQKEFS